MKTKEKKLQVILGIVLVASFAVGVFYPFANDLLGVPTEVTIWYESGRSTSWVYPQDSAFPSFGEGLLYRFGLWTLFLAAPIYLVPPVIHLLPRIALWIAAVISIFIILRYSYGISKKRRFAYVYLISGQIASFAAPLFVWHSSYSQSIFPEV